MRRAGLTLALLAGCGAPANDGGAWGLSADACDVVGSPESAACGVAAANLAGCCFDGWNGSAEFRGLSGSALCRRAVARGESPLAACGALGTVAGDCGGVRLYASRGIGTGEAGCCCAAGVACGGAADGFVCR